ncbi:MAG: hypothetical protein GF331_02640 [Chitinivibrionales bacterium]|nr:hypothetical protein [Chitinivibrionales bacterium]
MSQPSAIPPLDVVGLGLATLDVLVRQDDMPTWEHGGRFSQLAFDGGGPVATAMVAAARLGLRAGYVGTAGNDQIGSLKMASLSDNGVDTSRVTVHDSDERQIVICYVREEDGERVFSGCRGLRRDMLRPEQLDRAYVTAAPFLHLDGFHYDAAIQAAQWAREAGVTVVYDGHKRGEAHATKETLALVSLVDILIGGAHCAQSLTGTDDIEQACRAALSLGPRVVVQTEGEQGSYTATAERFFHTPPFSVDVVDTTGAGDVFHGAYIVGLHHGWPRERIARFATAVSAITCTHLGGRHGIPTFDQTMAFLKDHDQNTGDT